MQRENVLDKHFQTGDCIAGRTIREIIMWPLQEWNENNS